LNNLFLAFLLSIIGPVHPQVLSVDQIQTVMNSSVLIRIKFIAPNEDGIVKSHMGGCSGTFVEDNIVLTAAHCVDMERITDIWIRSYDGQSHKAFIVKKDKGHDLALLGILGIQHKPIKLARTVVLGEQVINVGSPYTLQFLLSEGIVSALNVYIGKEFKSHYLVTTAMINPGSSGGGAFNKEGELIGVNTMTMGGFMGWAGISLAVSLEDIKEFLQ